ncbi:MAG: hypothetical protein PUE01_04355 [Clostridiaceae bacterium]|nr:hypothetical protein [Clostridiaceae bacterium]
MGIIIFYYLRCILEILLMCFSIFSVSKTKLDRRKFAKAFLFLFCSMLIIAKLPIEQSVQCILNIILLFIGNYTIFKFDIICSIKYSVIVIAIIMLSEAVGMGIIFLIARDVFEIAVSSSIEVASFYTSPVLIIYIIVVFGYYFMAKKKGQLSS